MLIIGRLEGNGGGIVVGVPDRDDGPEVARRISCDD